MNEKRSEKRNLDFKHFATFLGHIQSRWDHAVAVSNCINRASSGGIVARVWHLSKATVGLTRFRGHLTIWEE
jgi:hypothetical protein